MATIVTRAGKGSPLTHNEVDDNFTNLNTDKAETSALAAVATSGSYNDLSNTPAPFDPNTLATVATTGAYSDLISKPTLGTAAATDTTAYATAAQGSLADSALQGNQTITLSGDLSGSGTTSINAQIAANVVNANELNVVGNGTATQFLRSDADGSFTWAVPTDTNTTYTAGTGLALTGTVFSNTITNNNQLTNGAAYITSSASISGNAATATALQTARTINTVSFDGTANISLSLANLGFTGASNANYITNNNQLTNGAGYTTYTSNQATNTSSSVTFSSVTAATFNTTSDIRLKDNIRTFESAMDVVSQLRGVRFAWKETGVETVGLIAQEVEKVLPELIGTNADTGLKSVSYANMVAVLIEAVKELKAEIEELKKR